MNKTHKNLERVINLVCLQIKRDKDKPIPYERLKRLSGLVNAFQKLKNVDKEAPPVPEDVPDEGSYYDDVVSAPEALYDRFGVLKDKTINNEEE